MRYTVYFDNPTRCHFVLSNGIMWSVTAQTTVDSCPSERRHVEHGVLIPNCEVTDWRRQCSGPNGWGKHTYDSEERAAAAFVGIPLSGEPAACKTTKAVV